jgi:hypothetical protein
MLYMSPPSKYITKFVEGFLHTQNINIQHISKKNNYKVSPMKI